MQDSQHIVLSSCNVKAPKQVSSPSGKNICSAQQRKCGLFFEEQKGPSHFKLLG